MIWIYNCVCLIRDLGLPEFHMLVNLPSPCFFNLLQGSSIIIIENGVLLSNYRRTLQT